jgi:putative NADPH-quinone reductase
MAVVVNVFHPKLSESTVNQNLAEAAREAGYLVRDLYAIYPDEIIDVSAEQEIADRHSTLVFQHPMYWFGPPSLMKKWVDSVLTFGWAYGETNQVVGKKWLQAVSVGGAAAEYSTGGNRGFSVNTYLTPWQSTAAFCGMEWCDPFVRHGADAASPDAIEAYLACLAALSRAEV